VKLRRIEERECRITCDSLTDFQRRGLEMAFCLKALDGWQADPRLIYRDVFSGGRDPLPDTLEGVTIFVPFAQPTRYELVEDDGTVREFKIGV